MTDTLIEVKSTDSNFSLKNDEVLQDYRLAYRSRQASLIGRREVMGGKAKFGIFGDGKESVQLAMSKVFQKGDFRSGYYRDQTLMFAVGEATIQSFFAQLYAHTDIQHEPATAGRAMNAHFATRSLDENGNWNDLLKHAQLSGRRFSHRSADAAPGGSGIRLPPIPGAR